MTTKSCETCGDEFEAKRLSARFCGATCRQRAHRAPAATRIKPAAEPASVAPTPAVVVQVEVPVEGSVSESTARQLAAAGRTDTPAGQAALVAASHLDNAYRETGGGVASLVRALTMALDRALAGAEHTADSVDELRARREAKLAAG